MSKRRLNNRPSLSQQRFGKEEQSQLLLRWMLGLTIVKQELFTSICREKWSYVKCMTSSLRCYSNTDVNQNYFFGKLNLFLVNGWSSSPGGALTVKYQPFKFGKVCPCKTEMSTLVLSHHACFCSQMILTDLQDLKTSKWKTYFDIATSNCFLSAHSEAVIFFYSAYKPPGYKANTSAFAG